MNLTSVLIVVAIIVGIIWIVNHFRKQDVWKDFLPKLFAHDAAAL